MTHLLKQGTRVGCHFRCYEISPRSSDTAPGTQAVRSEITAGEECTCACVSVTTMSNDAVITVSQAVSLCHKVENLHNGQY